MDDQRVEQLADGLGRGELPEDVQPQDAAAAARMLADSLIPPHGGAAVHQLRAACRVLNKRRHFEPARRLGEAWLDGRGFDPTLAKHVAQALVNLSALDAAEQVLHNGLGCVLQPGAGAEAVVQAPEFEGLLARVTKQRFVATADRDLLVKATEQYLQARRRAPAGTAFWPAINAVALLKRQEREGLPPTPGVAAKALAEAVRAEAAQRYKKDPSDPWLAATLSESCLALDKCDAAELWLYRFINHPKIEPFDLDSYDRQLREIWQANPLGGGRRCADRLAAIMSRHLQRTQARLSVSASMVRQMRADPDWFEKNFSGERGFSLGTLKGMLAACASIGCVTNRRGERLGTGFLVSGLVLNATFGAAPVFVTNAHVLSAEAPDAVRPADALVNFEVESTTTNMPVSYAVAETLFTSPPGPIGMCGDRLDRLDTTIVRLAGLADTHAGLRAAEALPLIDARAKAYVVGHPHGGGLQISLHDSVLLDIDDDERVVHYRTPTEPGSSGSPVFNAQWEVIALHRAGSHTMPRLRGHGSYEANEGIALSAIRRRLNT